MKKNNLNLGEQFVKAVTEDIEAGKLDENIIELPRRDIYYTKIYEYLIRKLDYAGDKMDVVCEVSYVGTFYKVTHPLLTKYTIRHDIARDLFFAMRDVISKKEKAEQEAQNEKILKFLSEKEKDKA